jgi:hypothetical protein
MRATSLAGALLLLCLVAAYVAPTAAAGYRLGSVVRLGGVDGAEPSVAVSGGAGVVAAWEAREHARPGHFYYPIVARTGTVGRNWGRVQTLTREGQHPFAAVGADGTAAVVWGRNEPDGDSIVVSVAPDGRRFSRAFRVGRSQPTRGSSGFVAPVGVEVQPNGRIVVIWTRTLTYDLIPLESAVEYATLTAVGTRVHVGRIRAVDLAELGNGVSVAQSESGEVLVGFETEGARPTGKTMIAVAGLPEGAESFATPRRVELPAGSFVDEFRISAGPGGAVLAVALRSELPSLPEAWISRLEPAAGELEPVLLAPPVQQGERLQPWDIFTALPADGATIVTWLAEGARPEGQSVVEAGKREQRLFVAVRPSGSPTSEPVPDPSPSSLPGDPRTAALVLAAGGTAMAVWAQRAGHCTRQLFATFRPAAGVFGAGVKLGRRFHVACQGEGRSPEMSVAGAGRYAILGWMEEQGMRVVTLTG